MDCPYCDVELKWHDWYGRNIHIDSFDRVRDGAIKDGDIYKCANEECPAFEEHFYTNSRGELREGYPC